MEYRNANLDDIPAVSKLQQKYHVSTISDEETINIIHWDITHLK